MMEDGGSRIAKDNLRSEFLKEWFVKPSIVVILEEPSLALGKTSALREVTSAREDPFKMTSKEGEA